VSCSTDACEYGSEKRGGNDEFTYTVSDGRGQTATATVRVTVTPTRLVVTHLKPKHCGPKTKPRKKKKKQTKPRCKAGALRTPQLTEGGRFPSSALPWRGPFGWLYRASCRFEGSDAQPVGGFSFKGQMAEWGKSGTNYMRMWVSFEEWARKWSGLGSYTWIPIDRRHIFDFSYLDDYGNSYTTRWIEWNGAFNTNSVGHLVRLRANYQWWRLKPGGGKLVFETGWFIVRTRSVPSGLCLGEPGP
jgi:hypothetical protein